MDRLPIFTLLLLTFTFSLLSGQGPDTLWTKAYGGDSADLAYSVEQTTDGGYIAVGYTRSFGAGGSDIWLLRLNANGDTAWTKTFGGVYDDEGRDVQQTSDGGYIITGFIDSTIDWGKLCLIKTDANGTTTWIKQYRSLDGPAEGYSVRQTSDGGYIITGKEGHSAPSPSDYIWLLKTDANGDTIWWREWGYPEWNSWGADVQETSDGGYILTGTIVLPSTSYWNDICLIKTNSSGGGGWTKTYGDSAANDYGYSVRQAPDGGYIIAGVRAGIGPYLLKTDSNGDSLWARTFGGSEYRSVSITADSGYIVAGTGGNDVYLMRMDEGGDTLWTSRYGGVNTDSGYSVEQTSDSGYIITGCTYSYGGGSDVYLVKTAPEPGIGEEDDRFFAAYHGSTIISGPLRLPKGKNCKVYDVSGRTVVVKNLKPGIYFIEIDGRIERKVVKVR